MIPIDWSKATWEFCGDGDNGLRISRLGVFFKLPASMFTIGCEFYETPGMSIEEYDDQLREAHAKIKQEAKQLLSEGAVQITEDEWYASR